jgi:hypothetical protein
MGKRLHDKIEQRKLHLGGMALWVKSKMSPEGSWL